MPISILSDVLGRKGPGASSLIRRGLRRTPALARAVLAVAIVLGLGATVAVWRWADGIVERRVASELARQVEQHAAMVRRHLTDSLLSVSSLAVFHAAQADADEHRFRLVAETANRLGVPAVRLGWEPLVRHADRAAFEQAARRDGHAGYQIRSFGPEGTFFPAPEQPEYFPIRYELLAPGFPSALGFDISSTPDRKPHVERARESRHAVGVMPSIRQSLLQQTGFLIIYWPVFAAPGSQQPEAPDGLRGYVTSLMRLADLSHYILQDLPPMQGRLVLRAAQWNEAAPAVIAFHSRSEGFVAGEPTEPASGALRRSFGILGMTWHVDYEPSLEEREGWRPQVAAYVLTSGVAVTLAGVAVLFVLLQQVSLERVLRAVSLRLLEQQTARTQEIEALNAQLREQERVAKQAAMVRSRLLASASHDVRQPLQAILVQAGIIQMAARDAPTLRAVTGLKNAVASLRGMFGVFLDLHRLDEGQVRVFHGYVDLERLLQALCDEYALAADRKGIRLRLHAPACALWTDAAILEVVLRNLIGNAVKFTRAGGVLVAVRLRREVEIQVWDTGPGIAPEAVEQVFEEFTQVTADRAGAGLGLSIARRMSALIGARIAVRSRVGRGSCFTVAVPRGEGAAPAAPASADAGAV